MTDTPILHQLAALDRPAIAETILVVGAHPDDETIGIGGQLDRLTGARIVLVTDGAPENVAGALAAGFPDRVQYAAARRRELEAAVGIAGVSPDRIVALGHGDQTAMDHLPEIVHEIAGLIGSERPAAIVTHAYEGGHPDHDAVAFAVAAAVRLTMAPVEVIEMPLYRAGPEGRVYQRFAEGGPAAVEIRLPGAAQERKRRMLAAHASQAHVIQPFADVSVERFRPAPAADFLAPPNGGAVLYESFGWGFGVERWLDRAAVATRDLGLAPWT